MRIRTVRTAALLVALLLALTVGAANAQWKITHVLHSWDDGKNRWESGNLTMWLNTDPHPIHNELFDGQDAFDNVLVGDACDPATSEGRTSTTYAGQGVIGLYHTDTAADNNAPGFQSTDAWSLVRCSALETTPPTKYPGAGAVLYTCTIGGADAYIDRCEIVSKDVVDSTTCGGNCENEIVTTININLDTDCDGVLDTEFDDDVCLYWEAEKPPFGGAVWGGNMQVRIEAGGGDKAISFNDLRGPTPVTLLGLSTAARTPVAPALVMAVSLGALALGAVILKTGRRSK